ncbi:MAG: hypothetical protein H0U19_13985 [Acidobacteria bacterium]|nr:hypothetical protein [Acidobacteriota bacterium]
MLAIAALVLVLESCAPAPVQQPFTIEVGSSIPLNDYICTQTATPSATKRFVIETVSFSGEATLGQTVGANFNFPTGVTAACSAAGPELWCVSRSGKWRICRHSSGA